MVEARNLGSKLIVQAFILWVVQLGKVGFCLMLFVFVGIKINYHLLTSIYVTSILSYTVLEDDANDEK